MICISTLQYNTLHSTTRSLRESDTRESAAADSHRSDHRRSASNFTEHGGEPSSRSRRRSDTSREDVRRPLPTGGNSVVGSEDGSDQIGMNPCNSKFILSSYQWYDYPSMQLSEYSSVVIQHVVRVIMFTMINTYFTNKPDAYNNRSDTIRHLNFL